MIILSKISFLFTNSNVRAIMHSRYTIQVRDPNKKKTNFHTFLRQVSAILGYFHAFLNPRKTWIVNKSILVFPFPKISKRYDTTADSISP